MSSDDGCLSQKTAFYTAGSHKPIEVKKESLARVAQMMVSVGEAQEKNVEENSNDKSEFDGDDVDDDLVFSTVPQRSTMPNKTQIHFDEIDDEEMRRFAESFEQEQQDTNNERPSAIDEDQLDDDRLCEDYAKKMQTPTKSVQAESNKRKKRALEDLDALLDDDEASNDYKSGSTSESREQVSPVFKKKPSL